MDIAMEQQPPPPALLQPFHLHSWSIYNPWMWASLGKQGLVPAPHWCAGLGTAGLGVTQRGSARARAAPPGNSSLPKWEITFPEKGILLQVSGKPEGQEQPQAVNAPAELRCSSSETCGRQGRKKNEREINPTGFLLPWEVINVVFGGPGILINLHRQTKTLTSIKYC